MKNKFLYLGIKLILAFFLYEKGGKLLSPFLQSAHESLLNIGGNIFPVHKFKIFSNTLRRLH